MKLIAVGDNVCDCYVDQKIYYPGGNCINVAVNSKRAGAEEVAYIGVLATDDKSAYLQKILLAEGIDFSRSRIVQGVTGQPGVRISPDGDRIFFRQYPETVQNNVSLRLTAVDLEYIKHFDVLHTSCYSFMEYEISKVKGLCKVSYDYSDIKNLSELEPSIQWVDYAFFSSDNLSSEMKEDLIQHCLNRGVELVCVTDGPRPVVIASANERFSQTPFPAQVVDTMGAGDSFISGFLTKYINTYKISDALIFAAQCAKWTCESPGGIGYPNTLT
ncbi:MAG: PfkB family carbohydrate kinase [Eubacteriales bacterium]|nr:PfkB family carbohydrate kinase [Eubacteriales bacterium]